MRETQNEGFGEREEVADEVGIICSMAVKWICFQIPLISPPFIYLFDFFFSPSLGSFQCLMCFRAAEKKRGKGEEDEGGGMLIRGVISKQREKQYKINITLTCVHLCVCVILYIDLCIPIFMVIHFELKPVRTFWTVLPNSLER